MTGRTGNLILRMAALQAADVRRLIQMTTETDLVGRRGCELRRIADVGGVARSDVLLGRAVAGLTGASFESAPFFGLHRVVWTFLKRVVNIFVAGLAHFRPNVTRGKRGLSRPAEGREEQD